MKVFRDPDQVEISRPILTIGIFDGVHIAHQELIRKLKSTAKDLDGQSTILTLWPHPRLVLRKKGDSIQLLNSLDEKIRRLDANGVENLLIIPFDKKFAGTDFEHFVEEVLVKKLRIAHLVVGFNHQFGKNREGNFEKLQLLSEKFNFGLSQQEPITIDGQKVSSSVIREYLMNGEIQKANHLLGYHFNLNGRVEGGNQRGRELGFPTANVAVNFPYKLVPKDGVYAVLVHTLGQVFKGMMNIGCRPTIDPDCSKSILEAHLFNFEGNLYNCDIRIEFIERIRGEKKFSSIDALKEQIKVDQMEIKKILAKY